MGSEMCIRDSSRPTDSSDPAASLPHPINFYDPLSFPNPSTPFPTPTFPSNPHPVPNPTTSIPCPSNPGVSAFSTSHSNLPIYSQFQPNNHPLVTDFTNTLSNEEKLLLAKGPKFALGEASDDRAKRNIKISFCRLANELRWREHHNRNPDHPENKTTLPRYPYRDEITQAPRYPDFERKLARINESISRSIDATNIKKASNLSNSERTVLANLKKKDIVCLPSDKGGEFCVLDRKKYLELGLQHLNDDKTYVVVNRVSAKSIETRINQTWKEVCRIRSFNIPFTKSYTSSNTNLASFYFLVKTHKPSSTLKIRPIVSNVNSPTTKLSWLLDKALKPLLSAVDAHLENTPDLCRRLASIPTDTKATYNYPFSLDVLNLYTSIPPKDAIEVVQRRMQDNTYTYHSMDHNDISKLLEIVLTNNYFMFDNIIYRQVHGLAMGNSVSAILAILHMDHLEKKALNILDNHVALYCRYVDDAFLLTRNRNEAEHVKSVFDTIDPHIKFEIEHPDHNNTLKLLDIEININSEGEQRTRFYKKSARKPIFVNFKSALPTRSKLCYIRNERKRIKERCSDPRDSKKYLSNFDSILRLNGYPDNFIHKNKRPTRNSTNVNHPQETDNSSFSYFNIPFYNDTVNSRIRKAFHNEGLKVRLSHKTYSLRAALCRKQPDNRICTKKGCNMDEGLCFRRNVVYKILCNKCSSAYIGSTIRELHQRVYEHFRSKESSVNKHMQACRSTPQDMKITIIDYERRRGNLRIREAFHIQKCKPSINSKEESSVDLILF